VVTGRSAESVGAADSSAGGFDGMAVRDDGPRAATHILRDYFTDLPDARQGGELVRPLAEVLLLYPPAALAGAEMATNIARFGRMRSSWSGGPAAFLSRVMGSPTSAEHQHLAWRRRACRLRRVTTSASTKL